MHRDNPDGSKTLFLGGGAYEVTLDFQGQETSVKRYYALASQRVLRDGDGLHFLLTDHLGSVVAVADEAGALESEQRYPVEPLPNDDAAIRDATERSIRWAARCQAAQSAPKWS